MEEDGKKKELKSRRDEIVKMVSAFCDEKIDKEYKDLCVKMVNKLYRKKDTPLGRGNLDVWAASVVYTVGSINFLFDKAFEPYIKSNEIHDYFGTESSTVSAKSKLIRNLLNVTRVFDTEYSTAYMQDNNPFNQLVMVDGFFVSIDALPDELQQMVRDARRQGEEISFRTEDE